MRDVVEIVVRLGETTLEHRFEPLRGELSTEWSHSRSGLADVSMRRVKAPAKHDLSSAGDRRSLGYVAVSLAAHLLVWGVATEEAPEVAVPEQPENHIRARFANVTAVTAEPVPWELGDSPDFDLDGGGQPTMGLAGTAGGEVENVHGHMRLAKGPVPAVMTKQEAIERARTAGILGSAAVLAGGIGGITAVDLSAGFDNLEVQGPLYGGSGEGRGTFGLARSGFGDSAGCNGSNCNGIIGTGRYGTISNGESVGDHWGGHRTGASGWPGQGRASRYPRVLMCAGPSPCVVGDGGLDKAVVRRYVRRELSKIQYCYEKELLAHGELAGVVETQFLIQIDGRVSSVSTSGVSPEVSACVAGVIEKLEFPAQRAGIPDRRGVTDVRYPFTFRSAGT